MKRKPIYSIFTQFILTLLFGLQLAIGQNSAPITAITSQAVCPGDTVIATVTVNGFTNITGLSLHIEYDPVKLSFVSGTTNPLFEGMLMNAVPAGGSSALQKVIVVWASATPRTLTANDTLANLKFVNISATDSLAFNNTTNNGLDCVFGDISANPLTDAPSNNYYNNGYILDKTLTTCGHITGDTNVCISSAPIMYSVDPLTYASAYFWGLPVGASGTSTTNSISVTFGSGFTGGNITVYGQNSCGNSAASVIYITKIILPGVGAIAGPATVIKGSTNNIFQISPVTGATNYLWSLPPGATGSSSSGSISVNFSDTATSGTITARANNICGDGPFATFYVNLIDIPAQYAPITTAGSAGVLNNAPATIPITVTNFDSISSISLRLDYDPALLTFTGYSNTNVLLPGLIVNDIHVSATLHKILMIWTDILPKTLPANSKIVDLNFTHISGNTELAWNNTSNTGSDCEYADKIGDPLYDMPTEQYYIDGEVHYQPGFIISGNINYNNNGNTVMDNVKVYLKQNTVKIDSVTTNGSGYYEFPIVQNNTYTLEGSCTKLWAGVNGTDALKIQRHFAGLDVLDEPVRRLAADVNNSVSVNGTDALKVKRRFAGLDNSFPRGDWAFTRTMTGGDTLIVAGANVTANFYGLCVGDVNGSNTPILGKSMNSLIELVIEGSIQTEKNTEFNFPVRINQDAQIGAISLVFDFPDDYLQLIDVSVVGKPLTNNIIDGQIRLAWSEIEPLVLNKGEVLLLMRFRLIKTIDPGQTLFLSSCNESEIADIRGEPIFCTISAPAISQSNPSGISGSTASIQNCLIFPNPAADMLYIEFNLTEGSAIQIDLIDVTGRQMMTLLKEIIPQGDFRHDFILNSLSPGVYLVKINSTDKGGWYYYKKLIIGQE